MKTSCTISSDSWTDLRIRIPSVQSTCAYLSYNSANAGSSPLAIRSRTAPSSPTRPGDAVTAANMDSKPCTSSSYNTLNGGKGIISTNEHTETFFQMQEIRDRGNVSVQSRSHALDRAAEHPPYVPRKRG